MPRQHQQILRAAPLPIGQSWRSVGTTTIKADALHWARLDAPAATLNEGERPWTGLLATGSGSCSAWAHSRLLPAAGPAVAWAMVDTTITSDPTARTSKVALARRPSPSQDLTAGPGQPSVTHTASQFLSRSTLVVRGLFFAPSRANGRGSNLDRNAYATAVHVQALPNSLRRPPAVPE